MELTGFLKCSKQYFAHFTDREMERCMKKIPWLAESKADPAVQLRSAVLPSYGTMPLGTVQCLQI